MELAGADWVLVAQLVYMFGVWYFVRRQRRKEEVHRNELILQYGTDDHRKIFDKIMEGYPATPYAVQNIGPAKKRAPTRKAAAK